MSKKQKTYLVTEKGSEDRLVKASSELAAFRHVDKAINISLATKDQIIEILCNGHVLEVADED